MDRGGGGGWGWMDGRMDRGSEGNGDGDVREG